MFAVGPDLRKVPVHVRQAFELLKKRSRMRIAIRADTGQLEALEVRTASVRWKIIVGGAGRGAPPLEIVPRTLLTWMTLLIALAVSTVAAKIRLSASGS